jgi:hypothetical protein
MSALLAGGGLRSGQIVGATNSDGGRVYDRPLGPGDLLATLYRAVGIDPEFSLPDQFNRPLRIVDHGQPIAELF